MGSNKKGDSSPFLMDEVGQYPGHFKTMEGLAREELRIGNYVNYEQTTHVVEALLRNFCISEWKDATESNPYHHPYSHLKGIDLTDDLILRLGFKRFGNDFSFKGVVIHKRKRGYIINTKVPEMKYVHQLQNYFYATRGIDLILN